MGMRMLTMKLVNQCQSKEKVKCREGDEKAIEYVAIKETNKTVCSYRLCVVVPTRKSS